MSKIPCKQCPHCGLYHDFTVAQCDCGQTLTDVEAQFVETDAIPPEHYGTIEPSLKVYVQKCSACGSLNYTDNPANPVKVCYNCHKTRISGITPVEYVEESQEEPPPPSATQLPPSGGPGEFPSMSAPASGDSVVFTPHEDHEDAGEDGSFLQWQGILQNIQKTVEASPELFADIPSQPEFFQPGEQSGGAATSYSGEDDEEEDESDFDWSSILGGAPSPTGASAFQQQSPPPVEKKAITLTAIRWGSLSFTVDPGQAPYMLGRSANQSAFLSQDGRVGNEHCYLFFRDGAWFVKDNHSKNGTAVNLRDIGLNGECRVRDGDELTLGHHPDSIAFRIFLP